MLMALDRGDGYYTHFLRELENLLREKGIVDDRALAAQDARARRTRLSAKTSPAASSLRLQLKHVQLGFQLLEGRVSYHTHAP